MTVTYKRASSVNESYGLDTLFTELHGRYVSPDLGRINRLIHEGSLAFYIAETEGNIIGMTSVISCRTATKDKLYIEDVAVLGSARGMGIGRGIVTFAMQDAVKLFGPGTFCLTSRPSRTAARALYKSLGFSEYETGVFIMETPEHPIF